MVIGRLLGEVYLTSWTIQNKVYLYYGIAFAVLAIILCELFTDKLKKRKILVISINVILGIFLAIIYILCAGFITELFVREKEVIELVIRSSRGFVLSIPLVAFNLTAGYMILKKVPFVYEMTTILQFLELMLFCIVILYFVKMNIVGIFIAIILSEIFKAFILLVTLIIDYFVEGVNTKALKL